MEVRADAGRIDRELPDGYPTNSREVHRLAYHGISAEHLGERLLLRGALRRGGKEEARDAKRREGMHGGLQEEERPA